MSHTPGPWWVDGPGEGIEVHDTFGRTASVWGEQGQGNEAWANARLISAAPDLYAVCKLLYQSMGEVIEDHNEVAFSDLRMALMKAEGET